MRIINEVVVNDVITPGFLRSPTIISTMHPPQFKIGLEVIKKLKATQFGCQLLSRVQDSPVGNPFLIPQYPLLSPAGATNLLYIHETNRLLGSDLTTASIVVVEFGGGYGYLSKVLGSMNEKIRIEIIDLPAMLAIQSSYHANTLSKRQQENIRYNEVTAVLSDTEKFVNQLLNSFHFHAGFSLSECTIELRTMLARSIVSKSNTFFIAFQDHFDGIDNNQFFRNEFGGLCPHHQIQVYDWPEYRPGHFLIGKKLNAR